MEVTVVGAGIVGCAAAALLAEHGARVTLVERERVAAGASGRNQGVLQHPFDPVLAPLYEESLRLHRETAPELGLERPPDGLLLVSQDASAVAATADAFGSRFPELGAEAHETGAEIEPALLPGIAACVLDTGHQVEPAAATHAWARRARVAGVELVLGASADAAAAPGDAVLLAAGPWTTGIPVRGVWGVTAPVRLARPPRHALEEAAIDHLSTLGREADPIFSAVTAAGVTTVGSTFFGDEPDHHAVAPTLLRRAASFLQGVDEAERLESRACARPVTDDGRPLIGRHPAHERVWVATGNGPWGMSCGPATARIAVDAVLGRTSVPDALDVARLGESHGAR